MNKIASGIFGISMLAVSSGFSQSNYVIQTPIVAADHTAKLRWNSEAGAVFHVLSADALTGVGPQGLQWIIREANCASKGTNAEWMDVGDPLWIPRILHPVFQPSRFYRVQKVGQATLTPPPTVTVQLSQSNGPIAGDLYATVNVTLVDTNQQLSDVKLIVDGQKFYGAGSNNFTAFINSCEWPNGPHEIYAVATMVDAGETIPPSDLQTATNAAKVAIGISSSRFVNFSNYISQFFVATPFFDPTVAQTQEVVATFPENTCWQLTVLNYQDTAVRHFTNQSPYLYLAWDGNDDFGNPLPFGFYDYYIQARPARFGCPSGMRSSAALASPSSTIGPPSPATAKAGVFCRPAMQFSRNRPGNMVREHITISSLNPTNRFSGTNSGGGLPPPPGTASLAGYPTSPRPLHSR